MNVLTRTAFIGIIAVGMCFVIISGGIDLSVGSMAALIAGGVILLMNCARRPRHFSPVLTVALGAGFAVLLGAAFGLVHTALLITRGKHRALHRDAGHAGHLPRLRSRGCPNGGAITLDNAPGRRLRAGLLRRVPRRAGAGMGIHRSWRVLGALPSSTARPTGATCRRSAPTSRWRATPRWTSTASSCSPTCCWVPAWASPRCCTCRAWARPRPPRACCGSWRRSPR